MPKLGEHSGGGQFPKVPFVPIPEGEVLRVACRKVEEIEKDRWNNETKSFDGTHKRVQFKFQVIDPGPYEGQWIVDDTPLTWSNDERTKLRTWVEKLLGRPVDADKEQIDTDDLLGKTCRILVAAKDVERREPGPNGETHFHRQWVDTVLPDRQSDVQAEHKNPAAPDPAEDTW